MIRKQVIYKPLIAPATATPRVTARETPVPGNDCDSARQQNRRV